MDAAQALELLQKLGFPIFFVIGLMRGWWHMGAGVDPTWKEIALRSISASERTTSVIESVAERRSSDEGRRL